MVLNAMLQQPEDCAPTNLIPGCTGEELGDGSME